MDVPPGRDTSPGSEVARRDAGPRPDAMPLPSGVGWHTVPNTHLRDICPPDDFGGYGYAFHAHCQGITEGWNSAVMDTSRNRLIIWGGGHDDYFGNEMYAFAFDSLTLERLNDPSPPTTQVVYDHAYCVEKLADGKPNSRHTYDGIAYMANIDRMFAHGGAPACQPGWPFLRDTWTFDFKTMAWQYMDPGGAMADPNRMPGMVTAYDPDTGLVFFHDEFHLYSYDYKTNSYTSLSGEDSTSYLMDATIDPVRHKFVMVGDGNVYVYDVGPGSTYHRTTLQTTGGAAIVGASYPGLVFDPVVQKIVAWNGGDALYSLDLDTGAWAHDDYPGGPTNIPAAGTFERFNYSPASDAFVYVNRVDEDIYLLRPKR